MRYFTLIGLLLLFGCGIASSPGTSIDKNIYVMENHATVNIYYSTTANVNVDADTEQDIKPELVIPAIPF